MIVIERMVQKIYPANMTSWRPLMHGMMPSRRAWDFHPKSASGALVAPTIPIHSSLSASGQSMAAMETAYEKTFAGPDIQSSRRKGMALLKVRA